MNAPGCNMFYVMFLSFCGTFCLSEYMYAADIFKTNVSYRDKIETTLNLQPIFYDFLNHLKHIWASRLPQGSVLLYFLFSVIVGNASTDNNWSTSSQRDALWAFGLLLSEAYRTIPMLGFMVYFCKYKPT